MRDDVDFEGDKWEAVSEESLTLSPPDLTTLGLEGIEGIGLEGDKGDVSSLRSCMNSGNML